MNRLVLIVAAMVPVALALPVNAGAELPSYVVPPVLGSTTTCEQKGCQ